MYGRIFKRFIQTWPEFLFSRLFFRTGRQYCPMTEKKTTKINGTYLHKAFTDCLSNQYTHIDTVIFDIREYYVLSYIEISRFKRVVSKHIFC